MGAIVARPVDFVVAQGTIVKTEKVVGSGSAITWLANAPTRLKRWICCRAILLLRPGGAIQLGASPSSSTVWSRIWFNHVGALSFLLMRQSYAVAVVSPCVAEYSNSGLPASK